MEPVVITDSRAQPKRKAVDEPYARRRKWYSPPAWEYAVASSA